jgi:hypothetical protein
MNTSLKIKNHGYTRTVVNGKPIHDVKWAARSDGKKAGVVISETPGDSYFMKIDDINELFMQNNNNKSLEKRLKKLHKKTKRRKRRKRKNTYKRKKQN